MDTYIACGILLILLVHTIGKACNRKHTVEIDKLKLEILKELKLKAIEKGAKNIDLQDIIEL